MASRWAGGLVGGLVGGLALAAAVGLAGRHPLWPAGATALVLLWALATARWPRLWLIVVLALLPLLDFAPWTGWLMTSEFDLLLLATLAGGWLRQAARPSFAAGSARRAVDVAGWACGAWALVSLLHGWGVAGGFSTGAFDLQQSHVDPLNSLRVAKSVLLALLLVPLLRRELAADATAVLRSLCIGMWAGMVVVAAAVTWERAAYPGLLDFSTPYRTTALFWEMHVGGAALDAYVALASPFAAWAVWSARSTRAWLAAAVLTLVWGCVGLTTFSRGVYLAVAVSMTLLAGWLHRARASRPAVSGSTHRLGNTLLVAALGIEALLVLGTGSFLGSRIGASDRDLTSRALHWRHGLALLKTPLDGLIGIGAGRLPARYAEQVPLGEFSGAARTLRDGAGPGRLLLSGPRTVAAYGGLFALTQRVPLVAGARYQAALVVRARTDTELHLSVCEQHLLYRRHCQSAELRLPAAGVGDAVRLDLPLAGPALDPGPAGVPRLGMLLLSVGNAGGAVEIDDVRLNVAGGQNLLRNGRFTDGLAQWFPVVQRHFLPWHIDNLALETLIEHGAVGLVLAVAWVGLALREWLRRPSRVPVAPFIAAAIVAVLALGAVSSVMDMPRVAFLFCLLVALAGSAGGAKSSTTAA